MRKTYPGAPLLRLASNHTENLLDVGRRFVIWAITITREKSQESLPDPAKMYGGGIPNADLPSRLFMVENTVFRVVAFDSGLN
jgi:hypothetical protein